ncbi:hypothetical protein BC829DRAFT_401241 [Chytridium lagenaria]|nr:hypothetical protein BC829DRAFT_401241 [Chytridium lagenaria]
MRREGRKHSDTFNDKLATNNTIHAQMKGASPARTRKNRNPATCRWSTSKETQPGKRRSQMSSTLITWPHDSNVKTAISSKHLRLPYMDPAATSPLIVKLDLVQNAHGVSAPEEMERLYAQIDSWTDLNLDKVWNVNMSTGRRATIFESERMPREGRQTKSKRRPSYWNEWDMGGKDMESSAKLRARMGGMRVLTSYR